MGRCVGAAVLREHAGVDGQGTVMEVQLKPHTDVDTLLRLSFGKQAAIMIRTLEESVPHVEQERSSWNSQWYPAHVSQLLPL